MLNNLVLPDTVFKQMRFAGEELCVTPEFPRVDERLRRKCLAVKLLLDIHDELVQQADAEGPQDPQLGLGRALGVCGAVDHLVVEALPLAERSTLVL